MLDLSSNNINDFQAGDGEKNKNKRGQIFLLAYHIANDIIMCWCRVKNDKAENIRS